MRAEGASPSPIPSPSPSHAPSSQAQAYLNAIELAKSAKSSGTASANAWSAIAGFCGKVCSSYINEVKDARRTLYDSVRKAKKLADKGYWACPEIYLIFKDVADPYESFKTANDQADTHTQYAEVDQLDQNTSPAEEKMVENAESIERTMGKAGKFSGFMLPHCMIYSRAAKKAVAELKESREALQAQIDEVSGKGKSCGSPALTQAAKDTATNAELKKKSDENLAEALKAENMPTATPTGSDDFLDDNTFMDDGFTASPRPKAAASPSPTPTDHASPIDIKYEEGGSSKVTSAAKIAKMEEVSSVGMGACVTAHEASKLAGLNASVATSNEKIMQQNQKLYDELAETQAFRAHTPWEWVLYVGVKISAPLVSCAMAASEPGSPLYSACASKVTNSIPGRLSCAEAGDSFMRRALARDGQAVRAVLSAAQAEFNISDDELVSTTLLITPARVAQWMTSKHPSRADAALRFLKAQTATVHSGGPLGGEPELGVQSRMDLNAPKPPAPEAAGGGFDVFAVMPRAGIATDPGLPEIPRMPAEAVAVTEPGFHAANESIFEVVTKRYHGLNARVQKLDYALPSNRGK